MLLAADISSHNTITEWAAFLGSIDILIVKISEGAGYLWAGAPAALTQARDASRGVGAYHFASATDPVAEADYFLDHYDWRPGEVPILDWEPTSPAPDPDGWCAAWCTRVLDRIGVIPMVYMSATVARTSTWAKTRALNAGLWVAQYGMNTGDVPTTQPSVGSWSGYAMWQYTSNGSRPGVSGPVDLSQFYGDANAWRAYGTPAGGDMPLTQDDANLVANAILDASVTRAGVDPSRYNRPSTNLRSIIAWLDARFDGVPDSVLTRSLPRQGGPTGVTSLGATVAWLDANLTAIKTDVDTVHSEVTALQQPAVDVAALAAALAGNQAFLAAIAEAVLDAEAARLQS